MLTGWLNINFKKPSQTSLQEDVEIFGNINRDGIGDSGC